MLFNIEHSFAYCYALHLYYNTTTHHQAVNMTGQALSCSLCLF